MLNPCSKYERNVSREPKLLFTKEVPVKVMSDEISVILSWFAGYSNFYSVLSVLICFCIMVVFILRLNGDNFMLTPATHYNTPKEQPMTKLHNPFSIQIVDGKQTSLKDGLHMNISVTSACIMDLFWGVDVKAFQTEIHKPVRDIHTRLKEQQSFDGSYLHRVNLGLMTISGRPCEFYSKTPETVTESSLGCPPRQMYPVVIVSVCQDLHVNKQLTVVSQFTIIHLKDSVCTLDSHIVYQFVKTNTDRLLSLQPIYLSSSDQDFSSPSSSQGNSVQHSTTQEQQQNNQNQSADYTESQQRSPENENDVNTHKNSNAENIPENNCESLVTSQDSNLKRLVHDVPSASNLNPENLKCSSLNCDTAKGENTAAENSQNSCDNVDNDTDDFYDNDNADCDNDCGGLDETNTCVICQSASIYYTLLPCRHACVCVSCVRLVDRCPMCRSYIDAFFRLYDQVNTGGYHSDTQTSEQTLTVWEAINHRLNEMLGFA